MPLTLEKLFSETLESTLEVYGETLHLTWAPARYTGEMDELAKTMTDEAVEDKAEYASLEESGDDEAAAAFRKAVERKTAAACRRFVAQMLVSWDLLDGMAVVPHDEASLLKLPDDFVIAVFNALAEENHTDPPNAPSSDDGSSTASSERAPTGTRSSGGRKSSKSRRGK